MRFLPNIDKIIGRRKGEFDSQQYGAFAEHYGAITEYRRADISTPREPRGHTVVANAHQNQRRGKHKEVNEINQNLTNL